jgi:simple sugar transport system ATP-binding protein
MGSSSIRDGSCMHCRSVNQRVEIVRCLMQKRGCSFSTNPSVLTPQAVRKLLTLRALAAEGCSILYISHKLDEIQELCDVATVLRAGRVTGTCIPSEETPQSMARMMIGVDLPVPRHGAPVAGGKIRLRLSGVSRASSDPFGIDLKDVHLDVHSGEIVGIAGISAMDGRSCSASFPGGPACRSIDPDCRRRAGRMRAGRRRRLGLGFVPEERLGRGALARMTLAENALPRIGAGWCGEDCSIRMRSSRLPASASIVSVSCRGPQALADSLSGATCKNSSLARCFNSPAARRRATDVGVDVAPRPSFDRR